MVENFSYWFKVYFQRFGRLLGVLTAFPSGTNSVHLAVWGHHLACCLFDVTGGPEMAQLLLWALTRTRPLSSQEIATAAAVMGDRAVPYERVRLAQGGILRYAFQMNKNRAFSTWHTINMPDGRERDLPLLVHELTHTFQFERVGSVYIGQALLEQRKHGREAYHYHGEEGLRTAHAAGKRYRDYNREQQGQITQDYCARLHAGEDTSAFAPFIAELRAGKL
jgi:hypothetical protein